MTVLVTGASGFIGGHVVSTLLAMGHRVRALDVARADRGEVGLEHCIGSVLDPDAVRSAMQGTSGVIHLAANPNLWTPDRFDHDRLNTLGTCRVLAAARREGVKVVYVSSFVTLVGRDQQPRSMLDEQVEVPPSKMFGSYARSKRQSELVAISAHQAGQTVSIVMPSAPVGTGDLRLTPPSEMIRDLALGKTPALLDCTLDLVDVVAVARACIAALDQAESGERYLLSGEPVSMRALADEIARQTGMAAPRRTVPVGVALAAARVESVWSRLTKRPPKAPLAGVQLAAKSCLFDNSKARERLGFAPRPWQACLEEALETMRAAEHPSDYPSG